MKKLLFSFGLCLAICSTAFINSGCSDGCDEDDVTNKATTYIDAAFTYAFDQTDENCKALKEAIEEYLDAADDCDEVDDADLQDARDSLNDLGC